MKIRTYALASAFSIALSAHALAQAGESSSVYFEPNVGQAPAQVKFGSRGAEQRLLITPDAIAIRAPGQPLMSLQLVGANALRPVGQALLPGVSHYQVGPHQALWAKGVPHYAKLLLPQVYAGVDLVVYGKGHDVEYDFVLDPA